ncbi:MAG: hypothetical protein HRT94_02860 [Alphaproteobacteria bacterium]|nr:hypothetical protein [Alphaproteobacteria bacterium]
MKQIDFSKFFAIFSTTAALLLLGSDPAAAQLGFNAVVDNIITSVNELPGMVSGVSYLLGLLLGARAVIKTKEHVENPNNVPMRTPIISALAGGAFITIPFVLNTMANTIDPTNASFDPAMDTLSGVSGVFSIISAITGFDTINTIFVNIIASLSDVPRLVSAIVYLSGLIVGTSAILKIKEHVEDANKAPLRTGVVRLLIAGALFSIPAIYNAMAESITPNFRLYGIIELFTGGMIVTNSIIDASAATSTNNANQILHNLLGSISGLPLFVSNLAYLLGLVLGVSGLFKIKEHVEDERTPLREGVIRLLVGGALFALPMILASMYHAVSGVGGFFDVTPGVSSAGCTASGTLGALICNVFQSTSAFPFFLTMIAYFFGTVIGGWAIMKFQEHVINPQQVPAWDPFSKMLVAGGLFSLPTVVSAVYNSVRGGITDYTNTGFNETIAAGGAGGLDVMLGRLMADAFVPMTTIINWFGLVAGFILVFIGISRLLKSSQEGARGPGGIGTIMTFVAGGMLISFSPMVSAFTTSLFLDSQVETIATLQYGTGAGGLSGTALANAHTVISAIIKFVLVLGLISIMRGIFIVRSVAEGSGQASMMAGLTHILGGALAVNLGPLINVVQTTLGLTSYGIVFS